jgi:hypothetical protein
MYMIKPSNGWTMKLVLAMLLIICLTSPVISQKNRPVANDVTILLEILQRDYYAIDDLEIRLTTLQKDRANGISILKAYTENFVPSSSTTQVNIDNAQWEIKILKQQLSATPNNTSVDQQTKLDKLFSLTNQLKKQLETREGDLQARDNQILKDLSSYFKKVPNEFLVVITDKFVNKFSLIHAKSTDTYAATMGNAQVQKSLNLFSGGALTLTNAIDGLATFLAKRIKEELAAQIFDKIKTLLSDPNTSNDKFLELKILLPRTTGLLKTISPEQYPGIVNSLKENIEKDLNHMIANIPNLINTPRVIALTDKHPEMALAFLGVQLINDLNKIKSPTEIIFVLESSALINQWSKQELHKNFVNGIKLASLLVYSITEDHADTRRFVSAEAWESNFKNMDFYNLFTGFLIQQNTRFYNIQFNNQPLNATLTKDVLAVQNWYEHFAPKIKELLQQAASIENQITELRKIKENGDEVSVDSIAQLLNSSITFLDSTISVSDFMIKRFVPNVDIHVKSRFYFSFARKAVDMYTDLGTKQYYNAITDGVGLMADLQMQSDVLKRDKYQVLIKDLDNFFNLSLTISKEIGAGTITAATLAQLKVRAESLKSVYRGTDLDNVIALASVDIPSTNVTDFGIVKTVIDNLNSTAFLTHFLSWHNMLLSAKLKAEGLPVWTVPLTTSPILTLGQQRAFLESLTNAITRETNNDPDVLKVVNFLVALSKAQTADDFSKAVEAIALPAGSAIIKRESAVNISLNAYAGFFGGVERVYEENSDAFSAAFTVPIGIALSKSFGKPCEGSLNKCNKSGSWTLFLSAIDIGAFTSVRFKDKDEALPEITFKNILAPGAQLIYGIPKSSFSVAAGVQYGPLLRKVSDTANSTTNTSSAFRYGISLLIDIPLINFYTKSKGYRK